MFMNFQDRVDRLAQNCGPHLMSQGVKAPARDIPLSPFQQMALFDHSKKNVPDAVYDRENWSCVSQAQSAKALKLAKPIS